MEGVEFCDIIKKLRARRMLSYVAYTILEYLDWESLKRAEQVSRTWRKTIVKGKIWKKLLERNLNLYGHWKTMTNISEKRCQFSLTESDSPFYFKKLCLLCQKSIQDVENNWRTGECIGEEFIFGGMYKNVESIIFQMDENRIVKFHYYLNNSFFQIFDRWTLNLEQIIPWEVDDHSPICYNFNKNFLAVGSSTGDIYVWDINQRVNCIGILKDYENWQLADEHLTEWSFCIRKISFSSNNQHLASVMIGTKYEFRRFLLTVRIFSKEYRHQPSLIPLQTHQILLDNDVKFVNQLRVDDRFIILYHSNERMDIRSTDTLEFIYSVHLPRFSYGFHYSNGLIITASVKGYFEIFSVSTCEVINRVYSTSPLGQISNKFRLINNKYIISYFDSEGLIQIWDLESIVNSKSPVLLSCVSVPEMAGCLDVVVDEFQFYSFGSSPDDFTIKTVVTVDFLSKAPFLLTTHENDKGYVKPSLELLYK